MIYQELGIWDVLISINNIGAKTMLNNKDKLDYLKNKCKENGLVFKQDKKRLINGIGSYKIVDSKGNILKELLTINNAFDEEMQTSFITQLAN